MSLELLIPLGLLGLLGIVVLIIIYIIRPNYQTKHVSSTYVWKLSLRYQKKRPPTSKLRNILIFICQVLILAAMAGIMAWPALADRPDADGMDVVLILDSSASMHAETDGITRFDRAVDALGKRCDSVLDAGGRVSVIVADDEPGYLVRREDHTHRNAVKEQIGKLAEEGSSYAVADIEGALELSREILNENPSAELYLYTDTPYERVPERVHLEVVRDEAEWNAAILGATAERENGFYTITVQIACYGISRNLEVKVNVEGAGAATADESGTSVEMLKRDISCDSDSVKTVTFRVGGAKGTEEDEDHAYMGEDETHYYYDIPETQRFSTYRSIQISLEAGSNAPIDDNYPIDDTFFLYGGLKPLLRVQYFSTDPNPFVNAGLEIAHNALASRYELQITEVKKGGEPALQGFDFYVFEHQMPARIPTDGAVLLLDPDPYYGPIPAEAGFTVAEEPEKFPELLPLGEGKDYEGHPVSRNVLVTATVEEGGIAVTKNNIISDQDEGYDVLLTCNGSPALMVLNDKETKIAVMSFSVHFSNLAKLPENFLLMYNIFDYFFPAIVDGESFEVGEGFVLNSWGAELAVTGQSSSLASFKAEELPKEFSIGVPGTYTFSQTTYYHREIATEVFVKPPSEESDIRQVGIGLSDPFEGAEAETVYRDLLLILASVLVALLFLEWWLQSRENK